MSVDLERLRRLKDLREQRVRDDPMPAPPPQPRPRYEPPTGPLHELVPGHTVETEVGTCYVHVNAYPLDEMRGPASLGTLLAQSPACFAPFHPNFHLDDVADYRRAAFIDTETTGLGNGSGVYSFMVGVGAFEAWDPAQPLPVARTVDQADVAPTHFVVRQYFMRNPAEERALLMALAADLAHFEMTVTFNGRTFDLPLLRARYRQNRRFLPDLRPHIHLLDERRPHLDLLHPARKLWRRRLQSCRLINLEQRILGLIRSEDDVPGHLIPQLYADYVRTGQAESMRRVFYHNHEDIMTMVALADRLGSAFVQGTDGDLAHAHNAPLRGADWAGLGRAYESAGQLAQAETAYRRALDSVRNPAERAELFELLGKLQKRQGNWQAAVETWQMWLTSVPGTNVTPYIELAKYCEWQTQDFEQAAMWTGWALHTLRQAQSTPQRADLIQALEHRLERLKRKLVATPPAP